jgi:hypothetical protein
MALTYEPISTQTISSDVATITFSSIPQTYTDLVLATNFGGFSASFDNIWGIYFNGSTANSYSGTVLYGDGGTAGSTRRTTGANADGHILLWRVSNTTVASGGLIHIMNYTNTTTNKTIFARSSSASSWASSHAGLWQSTSAITSVTLKWLDSNQRYKTGSTFTLYGIKAA